ncbi:hypothetical protein [Polyangium sp. y55x31]|uniref:hypothetical protein n=1 Tax=Polyangium sp. y55x31 TaxID=3042688 RepID=UPI002482F985|nr:hypothetical protein [Polyangium sp. y55x31]MDI1479457.1 hypothetical protein [Polyangium sp. y55x31]
MKNLLLSSIRPLFLLGFLAAALPACSTDAEAVCELKCDCEGCSPGQLDDCYRHIDNEEIEADRRGCLDYWDELQACEYDTGRCGGSDWSTSCKNEKERWDNCRK